MYNKRKVGMACTNCCAKEEVEGSVCGYTRSNLGGEMQKFARARETKNE